ncbi:alpha-L-fucosidase [Paenibacillus aquistagni]|uniref:alpha-L-fucosidase n=1 Tax=Paenibacillus aquistagni TaxID=1852522 RepID=UPI002165B278|nr:alpha-L-fucosidase [Paenibacillus aquistagni]
MSQMLNKEEMRGQEERMKWWTDAKFGMFIHWGLYAIPGKGEWHMYGAKIPVKEYERLADEFEPQAFDAKTWVAIAKRAGMKYIVITAKHHDGFAMYDSKTEPFNMVQATPYRRDPLQELAQVCREEDIKLCFYYSHVIDWHHPHSVHNAANNTWDYNMGEKHFPTYWNELVKPQIQELLTQYGDIGLIWFDTAGGLSYEDSIDMMNHVRRLQPNCLMNSRVSHYKGLGDYQSKGDNETPMYGEDTRLWETPMTLNETWGFSPRDQRWKTTDSLIRKLVNIVSKGGNLLLNVGPSPQGIIPEESVQRLEQIGDWLRRNADAIYGATASPFPYEMDWGAITMKENQLFLHIDNERWPKSALRINGILSKVKRAYWLADREQQPLSCQQSCADSQDEQHTGAGLQIRLPKAPFDQTVTVVVLEMEGRVEVDPQIMVLPSGVLTVDITTGEITENDWNDSNDSGNSSEQKPEANRSKLSPAVSRTAAWSIMIPEQGTFEVQITSFKRHDADFQEAFGEGVQLRLADQVLRSIPAEDSEISDSPACQHPYSEMISILGEIHIHTPGVYPMDLMSTLIKGRNPTFTEIWQADKVKLRSVRLVKKPD